jgi:hypothetical protein
MKSKVLFLLALVASLSKAAKSEKVVIKNGSVYGGTRLLEAELAGKSVELECHIKEKSCTDVTVGDYSMVRISPNSANDEALNRVKW